MLSACLLVIFNGKMLVFSSPTVILFNYTFIMFVRKNLVNTGGIWKGTKKTSFTRDKQKQSLLMSS